MPVPAIRRFPDGLPDALLDLDERALLRELGKPTLVRVPGEGQAPPRAIATLLHGDESTGLQAVLRILRRRRRYPFDLHVVVGNVAAALAGPGFAHRYLESQQDFNRVWSDPPGPTDWSDPPGPTEPGDRTEASAGDDAVAVQRRAAAEILAELEAAGIESLVDVHNNSGDNPFYAVVPRDRPDVLNLATLFTSTLLRWDLGAGTLMESIDERCAAIAVECGLPGRPESLAFALDALRRYLGEPPLERDRTMRDHDTLGDLRKVTVRGEIRFRFGGSLDANTDLVLPADADVVNFVEVPAGHLLGWVRAGAPTPLTVTDRDGCDVTATHIGVEPDGQVVLRRPGTPVMITRTVAAARKDCLLYLATALPPPAL